MRRKNLFLLLFLLFGFTAAYAQTTRDVAPPKAPEPQWQSSKKKKSFLGLRFKKKPQTHREAYDARMKQVAKDKKKEAKMLEKPQYSNPIYFGHKRPPKKRPAHKMKYCKVCQLRH